MKVDGVAYRSIWREGEGTAVTVVDQTLLPHRFETLTISTVAEAIDAIKRMVVRGAPLIGVTGAYGYAMALAADPSDTNLASAYDALYAARPTAVNLRWALDIVRAEMQPLAPEARAARAIPCGLLQDGKVTQAIRKGDLITHSNASVAPGSRIAALRARQDALVYGKEA